MGVDKYLRICEQLGEEPDPQKMPLELSDFPEEAQVAFFISGLLEDKWEGMSGSYMGKNWSNTEYLFKLYEVEETKTVFYIMKMYEASIVEMRSKESERKRKAEGRKSAGGGKNYTHNVTG
mgnify:CR=1 FL=1|tara:strand:+ start:5510 stop:5872 length:363 start_codon:yes stop_codon:yes gene_type:complete